MEPRILFSADGLSALLNTPLDADQDALALDAPPVLPADTQEHHTATATPDMPPEPAMRTELVVIDSRVADYQQLVEDIQARSTSDAWFEIIVLNQTLSGIEQIGDLLAQRQDVSALHIISHGADGGVQLGADWVDSQSLQQQAEALALWKAALTDNADVLVYGCDVAEGSAGHTFIQELAHLTGADVAASSNLTGSAALGGDWVLEEHIGFIDTPILLSGVTQGAWYGTLATYTVSNLNDSGAGSLRDAITLSNASTTVDDTIVFAVSGTINLASTLTISDTVSINASSGGVPSILLDGNNLGTEAFVLTASADNSTIRGFVIRDFNADAIAIAPGSDGNTITGNYIGSLTLTGTNAGAAEANSLAGIYIQGSGNIISNNVISGNFGSASLGGGIEIEGNGNVVTGNTIGLALDGTTVIGNNNGPGVLLILGASNNRIGTNGDGTNDAAERNVISGNGYGVQITGAGTNSNVVAGNFIGLNAAGTGLAGNTNAGVGILDGASNNLIGGDAIAERNVISGNSDGIRIGGLADGANSNIVQGNYIGTDVTGTLDLGNSDTGVEIENNNLNTNVIGNVISGNSGVGVFVGGGSTIVRGNYVGVDANGATALANGGYGIDVGANVLNATIGGAGIGAGNVVSSNGNAGILFEVGSSGSIKGNLIGTNASGTNSIGGNGAAIFIATSNVQVGGVLAGEGNTVSGSNTAGIIVNGGSGNSILGNSIFGNAGLGIDLSNNGVTANDTGDGDAGSNALQNFPVLTATTSGGSTTVLGTLNSNASTSYRIEFFSSPTGDPSGNGEARTYLGFVTVRTNAAGNGAFNAYFAGTGVTTGHVVTATATVDLGGGNYGSTSEFSLNATVTSAAVNTVPVAQTVNEDTLLVFSSGNGNLISIADSNAGVGTMQVALSVTNGTLTLSGTAGLTFVSGANGTGAMTVTGTLASINTALNGLAFQPNANYNGAALLSLSSQDSEILSLNISSNLVGWYQFSGNTTDTSPGVLQNATLMDGATLANDAVRGPVLSLDGVNDYAVITGTFSNPTEVSIGAWVNLNDGSALRREVISLNDRVHIALNDGGSGVKGSVQIAPGSWVDLPSGQLLAAGEWHHVMYTYSDTGNVHHLYIDGTLVASASIFNSIDWSGAAGDTQIGRHPGNFAFFTGKIDDARIYDRALMAAEVVKLASDLTLNDADTVAITVNPVNDAPTSAPITLTPIAENSGARLITQAELLAGASDIEGSALTAVGLTISSGSGSLVNNGNGTWSYTPALNDDTSVVFSYGVSDGSLTGGGSATLDITPAVNNAPVGVADSYSVNEDSTLTVNWWDNDWTRRSQITFSGNTFVGATNLADFPVLIKLNSSNIDYAQTQNAGQDLRFVDANGTLLAYEIEKWNEAGDSYVWVRVPQVDASGSDSIFMYFGNAAAIAGQNGAAVWSNNYSAVYHMGSTGTAIIDSTGNGVTGVATNGPTVGTGQVGDDRVFDSVNDYINLGSNRSLIDGASGVTYSTLVNPASTAGTATEGIVSTSINNGGVTSGTSRFALERIGANLQVIVRSDDATSFIANTTSNPLVAGVWKQIAVTVDVVSDTVLVYVDGVLQPTTTTGSLPGTAFPNSPSASNAIAAADDGTGIYFNGQIDETRVSKAVRSAAWVQAEYLNMTNSFVTVGAAVAAPATSGVLGNDTDDGTLLSAVLVSGPSHAASFTLNPDGTFNYTPVANYAGADSFVYRATDGSLNSADVTVSITVNPVNDAPANTVPGARSVNEDTALAVPGLSINDIDAGAGSLTTQLTVSSGTLNVSLAGGASISSGANGSNTLTLSGTQGQINAALATLTYQGNLNFNGSDSLQVVTNDQGNTGAGGALSDTDTVAISVNAVNDAPTAAIVPASYTATEQVALTLHGTGLSIADVDAGVALVRATVSVTSGILNAAAGTTGVTVSGSGTATVTLDGTLTQINNLLAGNLSGTLTYTANSDTPAASTTLTLTASDLGNTGAGGTLTGNDTATINITAVNDAPTATIVPVSYAAAEQVALALHGTGLSIADVDASAAAVRATVSVTSGILNATAGTTGVTVSGFGTATVTLDGTLTQINNLLAGNLGGTLTYTANSDTPAASATLTLTASDLGNTGTGGTLTGNDTAIIDITAISDAPVNTVPGAQSTNEDTALVFSSGNGNLISISDVDAGGSPLEVTISVTNGALTLSGTGGLTFVNGDGVSDASMTFRGTVANINAALNGMTFAPAADYNGGAVLTLSTLDSTLLSLKTDASLQGWYEFSGNANDTGPGTAQNATLFNGATIVTDGTRGQVLSLDGVDDYADLSASTADYAGFTQGTISGWIRATGTFETIFSISDTADTGSYASLFLGASGYLTFEVVENGVMQLAVYRSSAAINDGNWHHVAVTVGASGNSLYVDGQLATAGQLTYDAGNAATQRFFSNVTGLDSMAIGRNQDSGGGKWYLTGSLDDVRVYNRVLSAGEVTSLANDLPLRDTDTVAITVNAINDAPTAVIVPVSYAATEQVTLTLHGTGLSIADVDAGVAAVRATLSVTSGILNAAAGSTGVTVTGTGTATVTLDGTLAQINNLLAGNLSGTLTYTANSDAPPPSATLTLTASDLGNTGSGGTLTGSDTATINITAVNDSPTIGGGFVPAIAEDSSNPPGQTISAMIGSTFSDPDAGASLAGILVTNNPLNAAQGAWQYSTDGGSNWFNVGAIAFPNSLALSASTSLRFLPAADYNGSPDILSFRALDNTYAGGFTSGASKITADASSPGGSSPISSSLVSFGTTVTAVNDAPTATIVPVSYAAAEQVALTLHGTGLSIADVDAGASAVRATLSVTSGILMAAAGTTGVTISGSGTSSVILDGTLTQINNLLAGSLSGTLSFTSNSDAPAGSATLTLTASDLGNTGSGGTLTANDTATINITAVNDAPTATITPLTYAATEQVALTLHGTGLSIADVDAGAAAVRATLSVTSGILTAAAGTTGVTISGSGTNSVTLDGTLTQINNLLAGNLSGTLTYTANSDSPPASATLTLTASDLGNTGTGGTLTGNDTATINITAVNDAPAGSNGAIAVTEDTVYTFTVSDFGFSDPDGNGLLRVWFDTLPASGTLLWNGSAFAAGNFVTASDIASGLLTYAPGLNVAGPGSASFTFRVQDDGGTANGGSDTDASANTITINITAVNDAPTATIAPVSYAATEQVALTLHGTGLSIADVDAGAAAVRATLSVTSGILTAAAGTTGVTISGSGTGSVTLDGTLTQINNLLAGNLSGTLTYTANSDVPGASATLTLSASDLGNTGTGGTLTGSDTATINITAVNDQPVFTGLDGTPVYTENAAPVVLDGNVTISDAELAAADNYSGATLTLARNGGADAQDQLAFDGITVTTSGANVFVSGVQVGTYSFTGGQLAITFDANATQARVNTLMQNIVYWNSSDAPPASVQIDWTFDDGNAGAQGSGGPLTAAGSTTVNITAVNDAPTAIIVPASYAATEQIALILHGTGLSIADVDAGTAAVRATLSVTSGILNAAAGTTGVTVAGSGTGTITLDGTLAQINNLLAGNLSATLTYTANSDTPAASATLTLSVSDLGNTGAGGTLTGSDTATINITAVNDAPVNTVPGAQAVNEDAALAIAGLSINDVDAGAVSLATQLTVSNGVLNVNLAGGASISAGANGSNTLTLSGTQAQINAALATLTYQGNLNFNGADTLQVVTNDQGNSGSGGALTDTDTVAITVNAVNDAPAATITPTSYAATEQVALTLHGTGLSIADVDAGVAAVRATLSVTSGILNATTGTTGVTVTGSGTATVTLDGTLTQINNLLAGNFGATLTYTATSDTPPASDTLTLTASDLGNTGSGGALTGNDTAIINITAVNDAPTATIVPASYAATEQVALTLHGTGLSIADLDAGGAAVRATISVVSGIINAAAGTTGVTIGGNGSSSVTLDGTLTQINNLLAGSLGATLTYTIASDTPPASDTLTLTASDLGNTGTGGTLTGNDTAIINITAVNDTPTATNLGAAETYTEDTALNLIDIVVSDVDSANVTATLTLSDITAGSLSTATSGGVTSTYNALTGVWTASGALADVNILLAGVSFNPAGDFNSNFTIATSIGDGVAPPLTGSKLFTGISVNDAPVATGAATLSAVAEDAATPGGATVASLFGANFSDTADAGNPAQNQFEGVAVRGQSVIAGQGRWQYSIDGGGSWNNFGALSDTNAVGLRTSDLIRFLPAADFNGTPTNLTVRLIDNSFAAFTGGALVGGATVDANPSGTVTPYSGTTVTLSTTISEVNDAPVAADETLTSVAEDSPTRIISFASLLANDSKGPGNESGETLTITAISNVVGGTAVINGSNIEFTPGADFNGTASFDYTVQDNGTTNGVNDFRTDTGSVSFSVTEVNDVPVATDDALTAVAEDSATRIISFASLLANDSRGPGNESGQTLTITAISNVVGGTAVINGGNIEFTPGADFNGTASFDYTVQDNGTTNGVNDFKTDTGSVSFAINAVNDAPTAIITPASYAATEQVALTLHGTGLSIADVDAGATAVRATVSVTSGILAAGAGATGVTVTGSGTATVTLDGTLAQINNLLAGSLGGTLTYIANSDTPAVSATLTLTASDLGNSGVGGTLTGNDTATINVTAVNDAPVNTVPGAQSVNENAVLAIGGISISDVDIGAGSATTQLTVSNGRLNLSLAGGATITAGANNSNTLTLSGTQAQINAALATLTYQGNLGFNGADTLQIVTNDLGNTGTGGALTDTDTVAITVNPVNDAPSLAFGEGNKTFTEGALAVMIDALPTVTDIDSVDFDTGTLTVTLSANASVDDRVELLNTGMGPGQIGVSGTNVFYGGTLIGTQAGGIGAAPFVVTFNANANASIAAEVMANIRFWVAGDAPSTAARTVDVVLTDGDGGTSMAATKQIFVASVNDAPVNTTPGAQTVSEDVPLAIAGVSINDADAGGASLSTQLTVGNGSLSVSLAGGATISAGANNSNTLTLSGTQAQINAALASLTYQGNLNFSGADSLQVVTNDLGNTGSGGAQSDTDAVAITVNAVNDAPVVTPVAPNVTFVEGGSPVVIDSLMTVSDVDSPNFDTGVLTVSITQNGTLADRLRVGNFGTGPGQVGTSGSNVTYGGVTIGTFSGGTSGSDPLIVTFNASATVAAVQEVAASIQFNNVSDTPNILDREVTFALTDGDGGTAASQTKVVHVQATNDAPVTTPVTLTAIAEGSGARLITQVELLANATDVDGPALTATGLTISSGAGSLVDNGNGTWTYTPALNDDTAVSFSYTVTDGSLNAAGTATLDITPVNDAPVTTPVTLTSIAEDSGARLITQAELLANASDVDGPLLTATGLTISSGAGSLVDNGNGTWTYTPALNDDTAVSFSYTVTDGGLTAAGTANLDITPVNDAPVTTPVTLTAIAEDSGARLITQAELLANATDVDGPALTATGLTISSGSGSLVDNGNGIWTYTPAVNDDTSVTFSYTVTDGSLTAAGVANLDITPVNDAPISTLVTLAPIAEDSGARLITQAELLVNATDVDGPALTASSLTIASGGGSLVDNGNGTWTYTPALNDDTSVSFSYTITDGGLSAAGTANLDITPVNDAPATTPVTLTAIAEDSGARLITQAELLANATDVDGPALTATNLVISAGAGGLVDNGNGTWTYTPALNDDTSVSFSYTITDGSLTAAGTANLDITPVNDGPVTAPVTLTAMAEDSGARLITQAELLANASDVDGPALTASSLAISAGGGSLIDNGNGTWTYTPALNDDTAVSFSYTISDGSLSTAGSANLDITPVNDAPVTTPVTLAAIAEDSGARLITQAELLATASDVDGPSLTASNLAISSGSGSLVDNGNGTWTYTPAANDDTAVSFIYTVTDGSLGAAGTATLDITPVNDGPVTTPVTLAAIAEDSGARLITQAELLANASDVDGPALTATNLAIASGAGSLVDNGDGTWTFVPALNDDTAVSFSYTIGDGSLTAAGTANLDIEPVNDAPVTTPVTLTAIAEDSGARLITQAELLANASDVDGPALAATGLTISSGAGSLVDNGNGTWTYIPALNDDTAVSFSYTVTDGGLTAAGTANLDITPVNDAPVTTPVTLTAIAEDSGARLITQAELLANAADVDGPSLTASNLAISSGSGSLVDNGNGTWTYTSALNEDTSVTFSYTVTDGSLTAAGTANLDITPVNDAPVTTPVTLTAIAEDSGPRLITQAELLANAIDIDGSSLTAGGLTLTSGAGTLVDNGNGTWTFTPALNDESAVSFAYTVSDGAIAVAAVANLDITPVNDAPNTTPVTLAPMAEDSGARVITQAELLANATDVDGPTLTAANLAISSGAGSLVDNGDGTWSYTPLLNDDTGVTFSYTITDGSISVINSTTLDLTPVNDAAIIAGVTNGSVIEAGGTDNAVINQPVFTGQLTAADVDNAANTFVEQPAAATQFGVFEIAVDGTWTYTLDNQNPDVQALNVGALLSEQVTVRSIDGTEQQLTIVIAGSNDSAVTGGVITGVVTGGGNNSSGSSTFSGVVQASDIDNPRDAFQPVTLAASTYGSYAVSADGIWTYILDLTNAAVSALGAGATLTDGFIVRTIDNTPQLVNIAILGGSIPAPGPSNTSGETVAPSGVVLPLVVPGIEVQQFVPGAAPISAEPRPSLTSIAFDRLADTADLFAASGATGDGEQARRGLTVSAQTALLLQGGMGFISKLSLVARQEDFSLALAGYDFGDYTFQIGKITLLNAVSGRNSDGGEFVVSMAEPGEPDGRERNEFNANAIRIAGISLTLGIAAWALRSGGLLAAMMSALPVWRQIDVLPILGDPQRRKFGWAEEMDEATQEEQASGRLGAGHARSYKV